MAMALRPVVCAEGEYIIRQGEMGNEMYFICRGRVEVIDAAGRPLNEMGEGQFFGELSLLFAAATQRVGAGADLLRSLCPGADSISIGS